MVGIVGRDGGELARTRRRVRARPDGGGQHVTPQTEGMQALLWHLMVTHPALDPEAGKWESLSRGEAEPASLSACDPRHRSMIITRTPLRITLGRRRHRPARLLPRATTAGYLIAAAIHEVRLHRGEPQLRRRPPAEVLAGRADRPSRGHPPPAAPRDPARHRRPVPSVEISSMADIPAGTGLGSSGVVHRRRRSRRCSCTSTSPSSNIEIAELACEIEIERLEEPIGKQDQYIAAIGGITVFEFARRLGRHRGPRALRTRLVTRCTTTCCSSTPGSGGRPPTSSRSSSAAPERRRWRLDANLDAGEGARPRDHRGAHQR